MLCKFRYEGSRWVEKKLQFRKIATFQNKMLLTYQCQNLITQHKNMLCLLFSAAIFVAIGGFLLGIGDTSYKS